MSADTIKYKSFNQGKSIVTNITDLSAADMVVISKTELEQGRILAEEALLANRTDLKAKGYQVEALDRKYLRKSADNSNGLSISNEQGASNGSGLQAHPELPFMGGKADQLFIPGIEDLNGEGYEAYLSESQKDSIRANKKRKQQQAENQKKLQLHMRQAPKFSQPKIQYRNTYKNQPKIRTRPLPRPPNP